MSKCYSSEMALASHKKQLAAYKSPVQQLSPISVKRDKPGTCPPAGDELPCSAYTKCSDDEQCPDVEKCCKNACGSVCVDPTKATNCIHLVVAVKKLPNQSLHNEYFMPIQCDQRQCWCVDVNYGTEIAGSAVTVAMKRGDMCRERNWFFYGKIDQLKPT
ncbi:WAP-type 'four-disulfide core [Cooperia oncophora]